MLIAMLSTCLHQKPKIDIFVLKHFRTRFLKISFSNFVYGFSDHITQIKISVNFFTFLPSFLDSKEKFFTKAELLGR